MTGIHRSQGPEHGPGRRSHRSREYLSLRAIEVKRAEPELSSSEAQRIAQQDLQRLLARGGEAFLRMVEQLAPICVAPKRDSVYRMVEIAAVTRLPGIRWLASQLEGYAQSGPYTDYSSAVAVAQAMASGISRPSIRAAREMLDGNTLAGFALGHPVAKAESSLYKNIRSIYARTPPELTCKVNVDLMRRLAALVPKRRGRLPTGIGAVGVVDGTDTPGYLQQRALVDPRMRSLPLGRTAPRAAYVRHVDERERACERRTGYKVVLISDLASTLPLIWGMFPARVEERWAARALLDTLFELWPECPMTYLVGNASLDHAEGVRIELERGLSIHPVFASHGHRPKGCLSTPEYNLRAALLLRRNGVASVNSQLESLGLAAHGQDKVRTKWGSTLEWLIQLRMLTVTATRYIHHTGLYERTEQVADRLNLLRYDTLYAPDVGPDTTLLEEAEAALEEIFGPPEAPSTAPGRGAE